MKTEAAEEENQEAETAAKELTAVKEEPKEGEDEDMKEENAEVEEKDKSLTDPNLEEQKPVMAAPPAVAGAAGAGIKFNITTKVRCSLHAKLLTICSSRILFPYSGGKTGATRERHLDERGFRVRRGRRGPAGERRARRTEAEAEGPRADRPAGAEQGL